MNRFRVFVYFFVFVATCLGFFLMVGWISSVPASADLIFGSPDPGLDSLTVWRLARILITNSETMRSPMGSPEERVSFVVLNGESAEGVIQNLDRAGLVASTETFRAFLVYSGGDKRIQPGEYELNRGMTAIEIADIIQDRDAAGVLFVILPGWRLEEVASALAPYTDEFSEEEFLRLARLTPQGGLTSSWPQGSTHEGLLFPDQYSVPRSISPQAILEMFLDNFNQQLSKELIAGIEEQGLTLFEAVTLASIVQREAIHSDEKPMIGSVFLNRVKASMRFEADPTVQYSLGFDESWGWWKAPLSLSDLQVDSPYNTYKTAGFPPGPIANPNLDSLMAIANPAESPYFFFRAACDGSGRHNFSVSFEEHKNKACP